MLRLLSYFWGFFLFCSVLFCFNYDTHLHTQENCILVIFLLGRIKGKYKWLIQHTLMADRKSVKYAEALENMVHRNRGAGVRTSKDWGQWKFQCLNLKQLDFGTWSSKRSPCSSGVHACVPAPSSQEKIRISTGRMRWMGNCWHGRWQ